MNGLKFWIIPFLLLFTTILVAQEEQVINPTELKQLTVVSEPATLYKGFFRAGASVYFSSLGQLFDKDGKRIRLESSFARSWDISPTINYGITDRLQSSLSLPYINRVTYVSVRSEVPEDFIYETGTFKGTGSGIGDVTLRFDYQILKPKYNSRFFVATVEADFPTGKSEPESDTDQPVGNGYYSMLVALEYTRIFYPFRIELYSGYNINYEAELVTDFQGDPVKYNTGNSFFFNTRFDVMLNEWLSFLNLVSCNFNQVDKINGEEVDYGLLDDFDNTNPYAIIYSPGISFQIKQFRFNQIFFFPVFGKNAGASPGYSLILQYVF